MSRTATSTAASKNAPPEVEISPKPRKSNALLRKGRYPIGITLRGVIQWEARDQQYVCLGDALSLFELYERADGRLKKNALLVEAPHRKLQMRWEASRPPELRLPDGAPTGRNRQWEMFVVAGRVAPCIVLRHKRAIVGYLEPSGKLFLEDGVALSPEDEAFLRGLLLSPAEMLAAHGRELGVCIFCGRRLSDGRSARLGYGKTCAVNFGMPWGAKSESNASDKIELPAGGKMPTPKEAEIGFAVFGERGRRRDTVETNQMANGAAVAPFAQR